MEKTVILLIGVRVAAVHAMFEVGKIIETTSSLVFFKLLSLTIYTRVINVGNKIMRAEYKSRYDICNKSTNMSNILTSLRQ